MLQASGLHPVRHDWHVQIDLVAGSSRTRRRRGSIPPISIPASIFRPSTLSSMRRS
jgi:hypothetical protein